MARRARLVELTEDLRSEPERVMKDMKVGASAVVGASDSSVICVAWGGGDGGGGDGACRARFARREGDARGRPCSVNDQ